MSVTIVLEQDLSFPLGKTIIVNGNECVVERLYFGDAIGNSNRQETLLAVLEQKLISMRVIKRNEFGDLVDSLTNELLISDEDWID